jgi:hypothetical protein
MRTYFHFRNMTLDHKKSYSVFCHRHSVK